MIDLPLGLQVGGEAEHELGAPLATDLRDRRDQQRSNPQTTHVPPHYCTCDAPVGSVPVIGDGWLKLTPTPVATAPATTAVTGTQKYHFS